MCSGLMYASQNALSGRSVLHSTHMGPAGKHAMVCLENEYMTS